MKNNLNDLKQTIQNSKQEQLPAEDINFIGGLGWLAAASISIAAVATFV